MLSRVFALSFAAWLPFASWMAPMSPVFATATLVFGVLALGLSGLSLVNDRARFGLGALGALVAFLPFVFQATLFETVVSVSWGASMLFCMVGPLSAAPEVTRIAPTAAGAPVTALAAPATAAAPAKTADAGTMPRAA
jgi:hypothetical protein